ncbi:trigger factor [Candidatus Epulonipiscioides gigas]|nr:trigger factor [Epulopiscium sp. SCG-C07WGA-EpuloA2]
MNTNVEVLENSKVRLTVEVDKEIVSKALTKAYKDMKSKFNVPGFRKGKVPRHMIEKIYGEKVFYDDAANNIINETFDNAIKENNVDIVAKLKYGDIQVTEIDSNKCIYKAIITIKPKITLGEYKNIELEIEGVSISDEEVDEYIRQEATKNAREINVIDRAIMPQDKVTIDFEGFIDGISFEGGAGTDFGLVIGSKSFIPGFEDQLIGKNIGDDVEVNVSFPENYHVDTLKGKPALFKVKIKDIHMTELPEINDEFVADVSEFDTLEEYKEDIRKKLAEKKEINRKNALIEQTIQKAIENANFEIPEAMIEEEIERQADLFAQNMQKQGLNIDQYLEYTGLTKEEFKENFRPQAVNQISAQLVLEEIAQQEDFEITDEEFDKELERRAAQYRMDVAKFREILNDSYKDGIKKDLKFQKAVDLLKDSAKIIEK